MGTDRIQSLQALRYVAAAMVVVGHACRLAAGAGAGNLPADIGVAGVDIFFVLSGFVIALTGPLATPRPTGALFFWRRWRRVAPIYYLVSIVAIVDAANQGPLSTDRIISTLLFWPAAGRVAIPPYVMVGWTLGFEMIFYSTVALVLLGGRLRRNLILLGTAMLCLEVGRQVNGSPPFRILANPIFLEFSAGVGLAAIWPRLRSAPRALAGILLLSGVGALAVLSVAGLKGADSVFATLNDSEGLWRVLVFGFPAVSIVAGVAILDRGFTGTLADLGAKLGDASYSIYLTQLMVLSPVIFISAGMPILARAALGLVAATLAGFIVFRFVETPILRDLKRLRLPRANIPAFAAE
ncbi:MAG: acyltransferase family protein [Caulobacteraceae bacterium]